MWAKTWACGQKGGQKIACQSSLLDCPARKLVISKGGPMNSETLKKPAVVTFIWAFVINFIFWFWVNVVWISPENLNLFQSITSSYSYSQGFAMGIVAPIFVGLLTGGLVFSYPRIKARLGSNRLIKVVTLSGLVASYLPVSLLGLAGIMYLA